MKTLAETIGREKLLQLTGNMEYLRERWQDEQNSEDFDDYRQVFERELRECGAIIVKFTKRPFKVIFTIDDAKFFMNATMNDVVYGSIRRVAR
jgi:hypothetical protein